MDGSLSEQEGCQMHMQEEETQENNFANEENLNLSCNTGKLPPC